ncbi:MAG: DeoR/GlpR family DNA-binding transcription regulator [Desulfobacterales bacterium]|nr:DeoR/GlpR family DNA-binding transcription regulator [Desulfobacterales bacterium]
MTGLLPEQRRQFIIDTIKKNFTARSSELSQQLNVSEMTIRRDLGVLEEEGILKRTHGGAVYRQERMADKYKYQNSVKKSRGIKKRLARKAAGLIQPKDVVLIGEGSTASLILRYVDPDIPFMAFTNNLGVAAEVDKRDLKAELIFLGGTYNSTTYATAGNLTYEMIERINANKVFFSVDGFSISSGLTVVNQEIAAINRAMVRRTNGMVAIMLDLSRFGLVAPIEVATTKEIDVLIVEKQLPKTVTDELKDLGIDVLMSEFTAAD